MSDQDFHDERMESILNSLDHLNRASANPFLFAKIKNRMYVQASKQKAIAGWTLAAAMGFLVMANLVTIFTQGNTQVNKKGTEAVATEYSIQLVNNY